MPAKRRGRRREEAGQAPVRLRYRPTRPGMIGASVLAAAVLALLWQGLLLLASLLFPKTVVAGYGTIEIGQPASAVLFRRETLLSAPCDGVFRRVQPAGERIARFGIVGTLTTSDGRTDYLRAPQAGLIVYTYDGGNPPPSLSALTADPKTAYRAGRELRPRRTRQGAVGRGEPLARLVDDAEQYLIAGLRGSAPSLTPGETVWVRLDGELLPLKTAGAVTADGTAWAVLRAERFPRIWLDRRRIEVYLVLERHTGVLAPARCLHQRGGTQGLMTMSRGRKKFVTVQVLGHDRDRAVVEGIAEGTVLLPR